MDSQENSSSLPVVKANMDRFNYQEYHEGDQFELLSAYLDGEVTATERQRIEQWLATDESGKRLYMRLLKLRHGVRSISIPKCYASSSDYSAAGSALFNNLFGTNQFNRAAGTKRYFEPKASMVSSTNAANPYFIDPWGYAYGYYSNGTNAPLIWSTASQTVQAGTNEWITSWPRN